MLRTEDMRKILTTLFLLSLFTVEKSFCDATEDIDVSGYNQDNGDDGDNIMDEELETKPKHGGSKLDLKYLKELAQDMNSAIFTKGKHMSFLENKDIVAAIVAGGVLGVVIATALAAVLIFKWQKCGKGRYVLGQETASQNNL